MTRFVRTVAAALALTAVLATPRAGDAQVLVNESTGTPVPLAFVYLNAGTTYYFTTAATSPLVPGGATQNPVLTLMSDWNVRVAGAQFCSLDFTKACFTYTPTTSNLYMLVLHGDNTLSPGRATVWQSQLAYCTNSTCNNAGPIAKTQIWNNVAFGGDTVSVTAPTSGRVHYHTLHRPGNAVFHTLFARTTTAANFPERISRIAFNGWSGTGRIRGTVKFDTTNPTTFGIDGTREWVVGPSFPDQLGAVRLVRNHWFVSGAGMSRCLLKLSGGRSIIKRRSSGRQVLDVSSDSSRHACEVQPRELACRGDLSIVESLLQPRRPRHRPIAGSSSLPAIA